MVATRASVDALLKELYEGPVNDQLNNERVTSRRIKRTSDGVMDTIGGKLVVFPIRVKRNTGVSYRDEGAQLADAGKQGYARPTEFLKYGYGRFALTGVVMDTAETNPQAFMGTLDGEMEGLRNDLLKDENRIMIGHKDAPSKETGIIAKVASVASQVITVDQTEGFDLDQNLDIINGSTGAVRVANVVVTDIDYSGPSITVTGTLTGTVANDYLARAGNYGKEPYGFSSLIGNTGTVHGIDSAAAGNSYWQSTIDSSTTTLTEQAMINMTDRIRKNGGTKPTAVFCSLGVRRAYFNILQSLRRYNEPKEFEGGLVGLTFNCGGKEIPVVDEPEFPPKRMDFVNENEMKVFRNRDWFFEDRDGAILKWKPDYDEFQGLMKCYWQLATHKRNAHGRMDNITEPVS